MWVRTVARTQFNYGHLVCLTWDLGDNPLNVNPFLFSPYSITSTYLQSIGTWGVLFSTFNPSIKQETSYCSKPKCYGHSIRTQHSHGSGTYMWGWPVSPIHVKVLCPDVVSIALLCSKSWILNFYCTYQATCRSSVWYDFTGRGGLTLPRVGWEYFMSIG